MPREGEKRKRSGGDKSEIYKMLRRIESRLDNVEKKQKRRRHCSPSSESETDSSHQSTSRKMRNISSSSDENDDIQNIENSDNNLPNNSGNTEYQSENQANLNLTNTGQPNGGDTPAVVNPPELEEEILSILGNDKIIKKPFSDPIQTEVASRWSHILAFGLDEVTRTDLSQKYLPPENCQFLNPPTVNPEVKVAVPELVLRRDSRLAKLQQRVGASLSAIGLALTKLLNETDRDNKDYIKILSDAGRLLADIHFSESMSRRELVAINLNKELKETLINTPVSELLFGGDLDNRIKAVKDLEKSGQQLKIQKKPIKRPSARVSTSKGQGNYKSPFSQKFGARKNGPVKRAPVNLKGDQRFHQKKLENYQKDRQRRRQY